MKKVGSIIILLFFAFLQISAQEKFENQPTISLGVLNDNAEILQMPKYPNFQATIRGTVVIQVKVDMQKGEVVSARAVSGHPLARKSAVDAALQTTFKPILTEFPTIYGTGVLVYKVEDFNGETINNDNPKSLLNLFEDEILNDKAIKLSKPNDLACVSGNIEVAVLVNNMTGEVISAQAISGDIRGWESSEIAALESKFSFGEIGNDENGFTKGEIIFEHAVKKCSAGVVNSKALYLPQPDTENLLSELKIKDRHRIAVAVKINQFGNVIEANAIQGNTTLGTLCEKAALKAKFAPRKFKYLKYWEGVLVYVFNSESTTESKNSYKIILGELIKLPLPNYPFCNCKFGGKESTAGVQVEIDEEGNVISAQGILGHPVQKAVSEKTAKMSRFTPTIIAGKIVKAKAILIYTFDNENYKTKDVAVKSIEPIY